MVISVVVAILSPFSRVSHITLQTVHSLELDTLLNILLIIVIFDHIIAGPIDTVTKDVLITHVQHDVDTPGLGIPCPSFVVCIMLHI